jgi:hypothetical protein
MENILEYHFFFLEGMNIAASIDNPNIMNIMMPGMSIWDCYLPCPLYAFGRGVCLLNAFVCSPFFLFPKLTFAASLPTDPFDFPAMTLLLHKYLKIIVFI